MKDQKAISEKVIDTNQLKKCWFCMRVTPEDIMKAVVKIRVHIKSSEISKWHDIGLRAMDLLSRCYFKDSGSVCGKQKNTLIGGAVYIAAYFEKVTIRQKDIADALGIVPVSVRKRYHEIVETLDLSEIRELYPKFRIKYWERWKKEFKNGRLKHIS